MSTENISLRQRLLQRFDPRRVLESPFVYSTYRALVTGKQEHRIFAEEYVRAEPGQRVLDVGCGPADLLEDLPDSVDYLGFDMSSAYIKEATRRYGRRARFLCRRVDRAVVEELGSHSFDRVIAHGLLHHLDDAQVVEFFELARLALASGGRLITLDGCFVDGQSKAAEYLLRKDRGQFVRHEPEYRRLAEQVFSTVHSDVRHDMYRIPYTLLLLECVA